MGSSLKNATPHQWGLPIEMSHPIQVDKGSCAPIAHIGSKVLFKMRAHARTQAILHSLMSIVVLPVAFVLSVIPGLTAFGPCGKCGPPSVSCRARGNSGIGDSPGIRSTCRDISVRD